MDSIRLTTRPDSVAVLTFDQPGSRANVLTTELWTELEAALDSLQTRTEFKGLLLASAKPGIFIAGADLKLLAGAHGPNDPAVRDFIHLGLRVLEKLEALPFPTCAAIDGAALGGGLEVALACDHIVCGTNPKVKLGLPEVTLGLIPGWGGTQRLPRSVGYRAAADMLVTGQALGADDAHEMGLTELASSEGLLEWSAEFTAIVRPDRNFKRQPMLTAKQMGEQLPAPAEALAAREALRVMIEGAALPLYEGIQLETAAFLRLAGSDESKRLIAEFFANRKR
jgi:enoyl-CoA hydratase/carnithine racemase